MENQTTNLPRTETKPIDSEPVSRENTKEEIVLLNEEISRLFEQTISSGVIAVNEDGIILSVNSKAGEIFGYSAEEVIGRNVGNLILLEYPDKLESCIIIFLKRNKQIKFLDRLIESSELSDHASIVPLKFSVGKTQFDDRLLITVTAQHIDQEKLKTRHEQLLIKKLTHVDQYLVKKNAELAEYKELLHREADKRKHLTDKLRLSQAMSSIDARFIRAGRLAEQISHDFNSLLTPLRTYPSLLKSMLPEGSECIEHCDTMEKIAHRLLQINDQLLALMSFNRQDYTLFDVNMILIEATNLVKDYFKDDFSIKSSIPNEKFSVSGRPEQLYRVFFNLLLNAKDAMREKDGSIIVKSEKVILNAERATIKPSDDAEHAKISIIDNGIGIPEQDLAKIFDPFYTTKKVRKQKSSGLGLTIVKDMVRDHNGFIDVESRVNEGTVISIFLPIAGNGD